MNMKNIELKKMWNNARLYKNKKILDYTYNSLE